MALASDLVAEALRGVPPRPWCAAAAAVLQLAAPDLSPLQALALAAFTTPADAKEGRLTGVPGQRGRLPPGPMLHMAQALAHAGPLSYTREVPDGVRVPPLDALEMWLRAPQPLHDMGEVCELLGWPPPPGGGPVHFAAGRAAVRMARAHLVDRGVVASRQRAWQSYAWQACVRQPGLRPRTLSDHVRAAWGAPVDGRVKEVFLRLTVNGVNAAGGGGIRFRTPCVCGHEPGHGGSQVHRAHAFWDCPVAQAVHAQLAASLPPAAQPLRRHVWLLESPDPRACTAEVWRVAAMVALLAMEQGRAALWAAAAKQRQGEELPGGLQPLQFARRFAVARFWLLLMDVAATTTRLDDWPGITEVHPFLAPRVPGSGPGVLEARVPVPGPPRPGLPALWL